MVIIEYVNKYFGGNQAAFARSRKVKRQNVTEWINRKDIIVNDVRYIPSKSDRSKIK